VLETPTLDGRDVDCVWHRLLFDGCIPDQTEVLVSSRASNNQTDLQLTKWQPEPRPYLRGDGSELPFVVEPRGDRLGTFELLFQQARGRYLQVQLTLRGDRRSTPHLRALRAYYPRFSYLERYLPAVYRDDRTSASFLDRFLSNLEGLYTTLEDKIGAVEVLFDVRSAPPDVLDWLAGWLGVVQDPAWDERRRRLFIEHAMEFFQYRGTARGIQMALQLVFGTWTDDAIFSDAIYRCQMATNIRIVEQFRTRHASAAALGDPTAVSGGSASVALIGPEVARAWRDFLARRYRRISALNRAYGADWTTFEGVPLPDTAGLTGTQAGDWAQFQSVVLAMRTAAHRFSVVVPVSAASVGNSDEHRRLRDLAARIVELEKPAQTVFDIKFYWALFRVGGVRLGMDTVLDLGSRAPQLLPALILQRGYLSEGYLAPAFPQDAADRTILGRDALTASATSRPGGR
jgi:phage tail-like protein